MRMPPGERSAPSASRSLPATVMVTGTPSRARRVWRRSRVGWMREDGWGAWEDGCDDGCDDGCEDGCEDGWGDGDDGCEAGPEAEAEGTMMAPLLEQETDRHVLPRGSGEISGLPAA